MLCVLKVKRYTSCNGEGVCALATLLGICTEHFSACNNEEGKTLTLMIIALIHKLAPYAYSVTCR